MSTLAHSSDPSLRTRQPSSSKRPVRAAISSVCCGQPRSMSSWRYRQAKFLVGPAGGHGFGRIEAREMLADDFVGAVALHALGADVPGGDDAIGREHEDRVVVRAVDEAPKRFVTKQRRRRRAARLAGTG